MVLGTPNAVGGGVYGFIYRQKDVKSNSKEYHNKKNQEYRNRKKTQT